MSFFPFSSSSSSVDTISPLSNDPHLEVTVTPSSSAFYAGETFSVVITLRNTRIPNPTPTTAKSVAEDPQTPDTAPLTSIGTGTSSFRGMPTLDPRTTPSSDIPRRKNKIGSTIPSTPAQEHHAFRSPLPQHMSEGQYPGYPYSPGANPNHRAGWPRKDGEVVIRSPDSRRSSAYGDLGNGKGHSRRTRSWALGNKGMAMTPQEMVWSLGGPSQGESLRSEVSGWLKSWELRLIS
jgi:hypothetical protein